MKHHNIRLHIDLSVFIFALFFLSFALDLNAQSATKSKFFIYQDPHQKFKTTTDLIKLNKENQSVVYAIISDDSPICFEDLKVLSALIKSKKNIKFYSIQYHLGALKDAPQDRLDRHNILLRNSSEYGIDAKPTPLMLPTKFTIQDILVHINLSDEEQTEENLPFYILCEDKKCELFNKSISNDYSDMQNFFQKIDEMPELKVKEEKPIIANPSEEVQGTSELNLLDPFNIIIALVTFIIVMLLIKLIRR